MLRLSLLISLLPAFFTACGGVFSPTPPRAEPVFAQTFPEAAKPNDRAALLPTPIELEKPLVDPALGEESITSRMAWAAMYVVDTCPYAVVEHRPARSRVTIVFGKECLSSALGLFQGTLEMTVSKPLETQVEVKIELRTTGLSVGGYRFSDGAWLLVTTDGKTYSISGDPLVLERPEGGSSFEDHVSSKLEDPSVQDPLLDALLRTPAAVFFVASTQIAQ